jgi:hypothetical protein
MKYPKLKAALGGKEILAVIENLPVTANGHFLTEEQMAAGEAHAIAAETATAEVSRLSGELGTANTALQTANATVADQKTKLEAKDQRIAELEATPPTPVNHVVKVKDEVPGSDKSKKYLTSFDAMLLN